MATTKKKAEDISEEIPDVTAVLAKAKDEKRKKQEEPICLALQTVCNFSFDLADYGTDVIERQLAFSKAHEEYTMYLTALVGRVKNGTYSSECLSRLARQVVEDGRANADDMALTLLGIGVKTLEEEPPKQDVPYGSEVAIALQKTKEKLIKALTRPFEGTKQDQAVRDEIAQESVIAIFKTATSALDVIAELKALKILDNDNTYTTIEAVLAHPLIKNYLDVTPSKHVHKSYTLKRGLMDEKPHDSSATATFDTDFANASDPIALGNAIRSARRKAGLSQTELIAKTDISLRTLSRLESGKSKNAPTLKTLEQIARATNMELKVTFKPG